MREPNLALRSAIVARVPKGYRVDRGFRHRSGLAWRYPLAVDLRHAPAGLPPPSELLSKPEQIAQVVARGRRSGPRKIEKRCLEQQIQVLGDVLCRAKRAG
jgi:hypothetical protein